MTDITLADAVSMLVRLKQAEIDAVQARTHSAYDLSDSIKSLDALVQALATQAVEASKATSGST